MKQYIKGFSIQLLINIGLNLIRILVAFLIIKYAPDVPSTTSFAKDSGWQIWAIASIMLYNIISIIISLIMIFIRKNVKQYVGVGTVSILVELYIYMLM